MCIWASTAIPKLTHWKRFSEVLSELGRRLCFEVEAASVAGYKVNHRSTSSSGVRVNFHHWNKSVGDPNLVVSFWCWEHSVFGQNGDIRELHQQAHPSRPVLLQSLCEVCGYNQSSPSAFSSELLKDTLSVAESAQCTVHCAPALSLEKHARRLFRFASARLAFHRAFL